MRDHLKEQLQRQMTRKEFLQVLAGLLLAVLGVHNLLAFFGGTDSKHSLLPGSRVQNKHGFGSSKFGV